MIAIFYALMTNFSFASDSIDIKNLSHVENIFQDKKGFVWFAGQQGLTRFDGEKVIHFSTETPTPPCPLIG